MMASDRPLSRQSVANLYRQPLLELVFQAASVHRMHHDPQEVQCSTLISLKTGGCPENCAYCPQSAHHEAEVQAEGMLDPEEVLTRAARAKRAGANRFCMGAAWREVRNDQEFETVLQLVERVKSLGLETCATLGMVDDQQAQRLASAGLDYYNHNLDTSPEFYQQIIQTRRFEDRLATLQSVRRAGMKVCCGGILGMGESEEDRIGLLHALASQDPAPESVPINALVPVAGTPLEEQPTLAWETMVRAVATARILMPQSRVRLSAGRTAMTEEAQALCFLAGANSVFLGDRLLTTANPERHQDQKLFDKLGLKPAACQEETTSSVPQ
ncbi:MAG: biotin synthase BioB [Planctomycetota bacterium]|nr:MAG: biotin synthase BioB [Planctomycetota bacterium]